MSSVHIPSSVGLHLKIEILKDVQGHVLLVHQRTRDSLAIASFLVTAYDIKIFSQWW